MTDPNQPPRCRRHRQARPGPRKDHRPAWPGHRRPERGDRGTADLAVQPRPLPAGRRAGAGQDADDQHAGRTLNLSFSRIQFTPDLMPADITGTDIIEENRIDRQPRVPLPRRAAVRQRDSGRRNQPHAAQDAGRAAGSHAGAAGHRRPRAAPAGRSVLRAGHAEPDRAGRHLSAARGAAGPLHVQGLRALSRASTRSSRSPGARRPRWPTTIEPVLTAEEILDLQRIVREVPVSDHVIRYALSLVRQTRVARAGRARLRRTTS